MVLLNQNQACLQTNTIVIPLFTDQKLPQIFVEVLEYPFDDDLDLSEGKISTIFTMGKMNCKKLLVVGLGDKSKTTKTLVRKSLGNCARKYKEPLCIWLDTVEEYAFDVIYGIQYSLYQYKETNNYDISYTSDSDIHNLIYEALNAAESINHARHIANMPSNLMTPEQVVKEAMTFSEKYDVECEILENESLEKLGANALLAVNQASPHPAYIICLKYNGNGDSEYTALVGKTITFDAGGYNLKKAESMRGEKLDMCGGANVLGAFEWIVRNKAKVNVMAILSVTENRIGSNGYTCDQVIKSLNGKTIEVANTDAEGRLILCDALTFAQKKGAKYIIDCATLTGAVVNALGKNYTGIFGNDQDFVDSFIKTSKTCEEKTWQLPLDEEFTEQVHQSDVADLVNAILGAKAGASFAAAFLQEFIEPDVKWIHLDVAGTADVKVDNGYCAKGATGAMVETIVRFLCK